MQSVWTIIADNWREFAIWNAPPTVFYVIVGISIVSALLITRFTHTTPTVAIPGSFIIFYFAGMYGNFITRGTTIPTMTEFQEASLMTLIAHSLVAVVVLSIFKISERATR